MSKSIAEKFYEEWNKVRYEVISEYPEHIIDRISPMQFLKKIGYPCILRYPFGKNFKDPQCEIEFQDGSIIDAINPDQKIVVGFFMRPR